MMNKSLPSHQEKEKTGFWLLNPSSKSESFLLILFFLLLPTQFGKHFWPDFSYVSGIRIDYLSPIIYTTDIMLLFLFCLAFFRLIKEKQKSPLFRSSKKFLLIPCLLVLFFIGNIFFSSRPLLIAYGFFKLLECALLALYLAKTIRHQFQFKIIAFLFAVSATFESVLAILQYLHQGSLNGVFYFFGERAFTGSTPGIANASIAGILILRPYGTFSHPNVLAAYLLVGMILVWYFVLTRRNQWLQIFASFSLLTTSIALLLTFSRVSISLWAILIVGIVAQLMYKRVKTTGRRIFLFGALVIGIVLLSMLPLSHEVFTRFAQTSLSEESVVQRTELLSASFIMIQHSLFLGVGLSNFIPVLAPLQRPMPLGLYLQPVHNIFVLAAAETGIIGLGLFVWLLASVYVHINKQERHVMACCFLMLTVVVITGLFDHFWLTLQQGQLLFSVIIGLSYTKLSRSS